MHHLHRLLTVAISRGSALRGLGLVGLLCLGTGCAQEYHWRHDFAQAEQDARTSGKDLFIFYKFWLDPASNNMLSEELSDPAVKSLFQNTVNLMLDKDFGPPYVEYVGKYGVNSYPASILVSPDGAHHVQLGRVSKNEFVRWAQSAKSTPPRSTTVKPGTGAAPNRTSPRKSN